MTTAYSWDEPPVDKPNEDTYVLLPAGKYPFTITKFERSRHEGSARLDPCPKAIVYCEVDGGPLGKTTVKANQFLSKKCDGLLCAFFLSIGLRKHGEPLVMAWDKIVGRMGICKLSIRKYKNKEGLDREANDIDSFLDPETDPSPPPTAPVTTTPATPAAFLDDDDIPF